MPTLIEMPVPLREDAQGVLRVGQSRVLLELVLRAFQRGESPEEIADAFPTVSLAEVYAVLAHYLANRQHYADYLSERDNAATSMRSEAERTQGSQSGLRDRLLARLTSGATADAATGQ